MLHFIFFLISLASFIGFMNLKIHGVIAWLLSFIVLLACYILTEYILKKIHLKSLDWDCDPEKYIERINKQEIKSRKNERMLNYLAINHAAGYISLGDFVTAREYLRGIEMSYLSDKNGTLLAYSINMILCHYQLGEIDKGEALYETNLVKLSSFEKSHKQSIDILVGERYFYLKKYEESYKHLSNLLKVDLNKRQYLCVLFRLAQMDIMNGDIDKATKRFNKIIKLGNKLWIVKAAKELMEGINK